MAKKKTITVQGTVVSLFTKKDDDYISLTDIAKGFETGVASIESWMRNRNTIEFLGTWERLYNPHFNSVGFDGIKMNVGLNSFKVSVKKWVSETNAVGIQAKAGKYGGTYAHKDIAIQFCYWMSPVFQLYLIKEFQRLKEIEAEQKQELLDWNVKRVITKMNYTIHTDAIKEKLIPPRIQKKQGQGFIYANEADILNVAVFGMTAKMWRTKNPKIKGNVRDQATTEQLLVLANLEAANAVLIRIKMDKYERVDILNDEAIKQMKSLLSSPSLQKLQKGERSDKIDK